MKITTPDEMEETFVACRYGALNDVPDLDDGILTPDFPVCDKLETCPGFGKVCIQPEGPGGKISRREYMVIILVAKGKLDKEIAATLQIELPTVRTYLNRIREKLNINNRIEIALWAQKYSIV
jgi:DNA-binding CsgD family transcriptional regulator